MKLKTIFALGIIPIFLVIVGISGHLISNMEYISTTKTLQKAYDYYHNHNNQIDRNKLDEVFLASLKREQSFESSEIAYKNLLIAISNVFFAFSFLSLLLGYKLLKSNELQRQPNKNEETNINPQAV